MATGSISPKTGKIVDIPDQTVTIGTATAGSDGISASVEFTAGSVTTGGPVSFYTATSSPGSITGRASSSPITVTGLTTGTAYTFTVTAGNPTGNSTAGASGVSNSVTPVAPYALSQTFNSSSTYTVPSGKTSMAAYVWAAGGVGAGAAKFNSYGAGGGGGGGGGMLVAFKDYAVTAGQTYTVTVGASSGVTSLGSLVTVNSAASGNAGGSGAGNGGATSSYSSNVSGVVTASGGAGGAGGAANGAGGNGGNASSGNAGSTLTLNGAGLGTTYQAGGGGGGGGGGGYSNYPAANGGSAGTGADYGGKDGGTGGGANQGNGSVSAGSSGTVGLQPGGGGGGGGGGGYSPIYGAGNATTDASGGSGRVLVYIK